MTDQPRTDPPRTDQPRTDQPEPRRRLHPLSPALHSAKSLAVIIAAISWQGYAQLGLAPWVALVVLLLIGAVILSVVSWFMTGYHVVGRELRVYEGVLWRRTRAIPLERLQSVEVVRPLLAQLTGLAELRLEVVGGAKTEAPLAFLSVRDAAVLRERLLGLAGRLSAPVAARAVTTNTAVAGGPAGALAGMPTGPLPAAPGSGHLPGEAGHVGPPLAAYPHAGYPDAGYPDAGYPGAGYPGAGYPRAAVPARRLHVVQNRDVFLGQLLTPQVWALPIALAFVVTQALMEARWGFIGFASTLTAAAGIVLQPVRRVLDDWNFRLDRDEAGLRMRHGLLETRHQTVPVDRVQAVRITWPLLWRVNGWLRMRMDVAGFAGPEQQKSGPADNLLPVGDEDTARRLLSEVLPGVDLADVVVSPPPRRARWLDPLAQPRIGAALTADVFVARSGVLTRRMALVPYARVQSVRIVQGPVQRMLGLATVYADTAAGSASAEHRELAEAREFAARLTDLARLARATSAPPAPPPGT